MFTPTPLQKATAVKPWMNVNVFLASPETDKATPVKVWRFTILFFTILGLLIGLGFVMIKRKIRPGPILTASFLGLLSATIWKILKDYSKTKRRKRFF